MRSGTRRKTSKWKSVTTKNISGSAIYGPDYFQAALPSREIQFRGKSKAQMFLNHEGVFEMRKHMMR